MTTSSSGPASERMFWLPRLFGWTPEIQHERFGAQTAAMPKYFV